MDAQTLKATARELVAGDRGLLAMDESISTCNKRFAALGIAQTPEMRRAWRDLLATTPRLPEAISGAILADETIRQQTLAGVPFARALADAGIVPGIKVDAGTHPLAGCDGEVVTEGLDGLRERFAEYAELGARFAKWRAVIRIGAALPSGACIAANAHALARYAALSQEAGLVPIVEPEVLMDGDHTLARCAEVTAATQRAVFSELAAQRVLLEGMLLKPNMVLPGKEAADPGDAEAVAAATLEVMRRAVPAAVPGVAFLSGGQSAARATANLKAMNQRARDSAPWALAFSFARAIQQPALDIWRGEPARHAAAQQELFKHADANRQARRGACDG